MHALMKSVGGEGGCGGGGDYYLINLDLSVEIVFIGEAKTLVGAAVYRCQQQQCFRADYD